jgi:hypothetical protein
LIRSKLHEEDRFEPVEGLALPAYVEVCRSLVRVAGDSVRRTDEVLATRGLSRQAWSRIRATWSERIRADAVVRAEFGRLYAVPTNGADTSREG